MIQTKQQEAAAGSPSPRKDWELFWRIIAGLMLLIIAWVLWVLYQITPRSVVTPLAFANQIRPTHPPAAAAPALPQTAVAPTALPPATAADAGMERAQAAMSAGAHQASADVQATAPANADAPSQGVGLRLATEITPPAAVVTPAAGKPGSLKSSEGQSGSAPAPGAAAKERP